MNQMNALEKKVGIKLLERTHKGVFLTEAGKIFYENIKNIILQSENLIQEIQLSTKNKKINIKIGTSLMRPCDNFINDFQKKCKLSDDFTFTIVPYSDEIDGLDSMLKSVGKKIDCFLSPVGSEWLKNDYGFLQLGLCKHAISVSKKHKLSKKKYLTWKDLEKERLLLLKRGSSYMTDKIRDEIEANHSNIKILDLDKYYDISTFNLCNQNGYLLDTLDIWKNTHPSLVMLPVKWDYQIPYGIIYSKKPTKNVKNFIESVANSFVSV
jgi:DNA-binding transcriptional LysR family regulator